MMDFEKVEFNKAISLNVKSRDELNPFKNSKFELVRLGEVCDLFNGYAFKKTDYVEKSNTLLIRMGNIRPNGEFDAEHKIQYLPDNFNNKYKDYLLNDGDVIIAMTDMGNAMNILGVPTIVKNKNNRNFLLNQRVGKLFNFSEKIIVQYLKYALSSNEVKKQFKLQGYGGLQINLGKTQILSTKIPLPPLEIQKQIVAECEKVEEQYNTIRMSVEEYQNLIKTILQKCGIIDDGGGYELNSILENLQKLESKLDFNLLLSLIEEQISHSEVLVEETQSKERKQDFNAFKNFSKTIQELLQTLSTPPKDGWKRISLKNEQYIELNPSKKEISKLDENMLVSFIEMASVSDKGYIQSKIDRSLNEVRKGYTYFIENDILIAKITPCMENGKCAIAKNLTNNIGFGSTEFHIFRAKTGLDSSFLFYNLNQQNIREKAALAMTGASGHKRVPISFYENLTIPLPPLEIQEKIVQNIELVEQQIDFLNLKLELLEKEKEKILQKYLFS